MDDRSFDEKIRAALLGYEDTTPVSAGWSRFSPPAGRSSYQVWLWASLALNAILITVISFFYDEFRDLTQRIDHLESATQTSVPAEVRVNPGQSNAATGMEIQSNTTDSIAGAEFLIMDETQESLGEHVGTRVATVPQRIGFLLPIREVCIDELLPLKNNAEDGPADEPADKVSHVSLQVLRKLEKAQFGKGVKMEYGVRSQGSGILSDTDYQGFGIAAGPWIEMWMNPFWSVRTGVMYSRYDLTTKDSLLVNTAWQEYSESVIDGTLVGSDREINLLQVPLILSHHLILSDRTSLDVGVGVQQLFNFGSTTSFNERVMEIEDHPGSEQEVEYHNYTETFREPGFGVFRTNMHYELGLSRHIDRSKLFWGIGIFYQKPILANGTGRNTNVIGVNAKISFRE